jgi:hypothetical protein
MHAWSFESNDLPPGSCSEHYYFVEQVTKGSINCSSLPAAPPVDRCIALVLLACIMPPLIPEPIIQKNARP